MPILDVQRRLHEVGRIRIGRQVASGNGTRPEKLKHFRFTSASRIPLEAVARLYGGQVATWDGAPAGEQFELYSTASELAVVLPPAEMAFSQFYELWSAGGCQRRCDGVHEVTRDVPCLCDAESRDCKPHTRVSVMLQSVPTLGLWRLDTGGWYAASELMGAQRMAELIALSRGSSIINGRLRVEARTVKRPDPKKPDKVITRNFVVPVLDFDVDIAALSPGVEPRPLALPAPPAPAPGLTPIPAQNGQTPSLEEQLKAVDAPAPKPTRKNAAAPLPSTGRRPRTAAQRCVVVTGDAWAGMDVLPPGASTDTSSPGPAAPPNHPPSAPSPPPDRSQGTASHPTGDADPATADAAPSGAPPGADTGPSASTSDNDVIRLRNDAKTLCPQAYLKDRDRYRAILADLKHPAGSHVSLWLDTLDAETLATLVARLRVLLFPPPTVVQEELPT